MVAFGVVLGQDKPVIPAQLNHPGDLNRLRRHGQIGNRVLIYNPPSDAVPASANL